MRKDSRRFPPTGMQECKKVGKAVKKTARVWKFDAFCGRILAEQEFALSKAAAFCTGQTDVTILPGGRAMIEKMADAIVMLLRDDEKRKHYMHKSVERSKDLDIKKIIDKWMDVILE